MCAPALIGNQPAFAAPGCLYHHPNFVELPTEPRDMWPDQTKTFKSERADLVSTVKSSCMIEHDDDDITMFPLFLWALFYSLSFPTFLFFFVLLW
ncbi:hypothetical protein BVRB_1g016590 isoform A [Beta vulgaris subsp. vulgaris]|nr:hypothetical protein BVRB_1g016590 isoform A [Beta vulgaris subsp. vulgaris]